MGSTLTSQQAALTLTDLPDAFLAYGAQGDCDAAFDDASEQAGYEHGFAGLHLSIASVSASDIRPAATTPVTLARGRLLAARALHEGTCEPGVAYALPICPDSTWRRRKVRLVLTDPAVEIAEQPGEMAWLGENIEQVLTDALGATDAHLQRGEQIETVTLSTVRHRYKPVVTVHRGPSSSEYVLLDRSSMQVVSTGHRTAGEARRAAVTLAKAGPVGGSATGSLDVLKLTGRGDGAPFIRVTRDRVASRVVAKVTVAAVKNPGREKTTGWLFYGQAPAATEATAEATEAAGSAGE